MPLKDDDIKQLIAILQRGLSTDETDEDSTEEIESQPIPKPKQKKTKSNQPTRENKFDSMMEKNMHKNDTQIDKLLNVHPPTIRTREFEPVTVQCRVCHKTENINPALISESPSRYKCNKCSGAPG